MNNPSRSELGYPITKIPRPLKTMRIWTIAVGLVFVVSAIFADTTALQFVAGLTALIALLLAIRMFGSVRIFEFGLESNGTRLLWDKVAGYRLSWQLGSQKIVLVEQATKRELSLFLDVFESDRFQSAVGNHLDLNSLVKIGLP